MRFLRAVLLAGFALPFLLGPAEAKDGNTATSKLMSRAGEIAKKVAKLRGLAIKTPIARGVMSKPQIKARILELIDREYTKDELDAESLGYKRFGLIPESTDYVKMMVDLLQDQLAGFYDQHEKKLYIAGWTQAGGDMVMAHEIDHALQDQHFDLIKFMEADKNNSDSMAARQALVEGDGMALMLEYQLASMKQAPPWGNPMVMAMLKRGMSQGADGMDGIPLAIREGLVFPYASGVEFIAHFRKHHSWKTIDAIYQKPPLSTEQILHPKKYESYEMPVQVMATLPASLTGYDEKVSNVMGEKGMELFLRTHGVSLERSVTAAAGWGGDRMVVYTPKGHRGTALAGTVGVWLSTWDEHRDASEFFQALEHALPKLSGARRTGAGQVLRFTSKQGQVSAQRKGKKVLVLIGAPAKSANTLRAEVWNHWRVRTP